MKPITLAGLIKDLLLEYDSTHSDTGIAYVGLAVDMDNVVYIKDTEGNMLRVTVFYGEH